MFREGCQFVSAQKLSENYLVKKEWRTLKVPITLCMENLCCLLLLCQVRKFKIIFKVADVLKNLEATIVNLDQKIVETIVGPFQEQILTNVLPFFEVGATFIFNEINMH